MVNAWNAGGLALVRRLSRGSRALEIAADELDVGLDLLCERATADDVRLELLARVLEAAGRTPLKEKIPALGLVLADGLREGGNVDEAFLLAAALDDLEAPHVRLVAHMTDTAHVPAGTRASWVGWRVDELIEQLPDQALVLPALMSTLVRHGLTIGRGSFLSGVAGQQISDLGRTVLRLLSHATTDG